MAFPVAVQSAIFYFMACTPCMSARNRYRTKKQFDKERKERAALEIDEPDRYRHPSPFNMNPYWEEEMRMGPSLPKNKRSARQQIKQREKQQHQQMQMQNSSQRNLTSAGQDSTMSSQRGRARSRGDSAASGPLGGVLSEPIPDLPLPADGPALGNTSTGIDRRTTAVSQEVSRTPSLTQLPQIQTQTPQATVSPTLVPEDDTPSMPNTSMSVLEATPSMTVGSDTLSENWNHKRYQREDEELWGTDTMSRTHKLRDAIAKASSSAGRLIESARLGTKELRISSPPLGSDRNNVTDRDRANFYSPTFIHPPLNDYHPPVVSSKPAHKDGLHWMLQPPPPAKVMEGKVPVSRSTSVASSYAGRKSASELSLGQGQGQGVGRKSTAASELSLTRRMAIEARMRRVDSATSNGTVKRPRATSSAQRLNANALSNSRSRSDSLASSVEDTTLNVDERPATQRFPSNTTQILHPHDTTASHSAHTAPNGNATPKLETILSSNTSTKENAIAESSSFKSVQSVSAPEAKVTLNSAPTSSSSKDSGLGLSA